MQFRRSIIVLLFLTVFLSGLLVFTPSQGQASQLSDIEDHWAEDSIRLLISQGLMEGFGDGTFRPDRVLKRMELCKVLVKALRLERWPFKESQLDGYSDRATIPEWARPYVGVATQLNLMKGYSDHTFRPGEGVNRAELAVIINRVLNLYGGYRGGLKPIERFDDHEKIPPWAEYEVAVVSSLGFMNGRPEGFVPYGKTTRAEMTVVLQRMMDYGVVRRDPAAGAPGTSPDSVEGPTEDFDDGEVNRDVENYQILGFYIDYGPGNDASFESLQRIPRLVDFAAHFRFAIDAQGNVKGQSSARLLELAQEEGVKPLALLHNYVDGGFDRQVIHRVLTSDQAQQKLIAGVLDVLKDGYRGVNIDFENIDPEDRAEYSDFIADLSKALHRHGYTVSVSVPAKTDDHPWSAAYDYEALGQAVDFVVPMAYDQHWRTAPTPGPIASVEWVKNIISYATDKIEAEKILLGLGAYGYSWPTEGGPGKGVPSYRVPQIAEEEGVSIKWDDTHQVPYIRYTDDSGVERILYYENSYSAAFKLELVAERNLAGIALWRLGYEEPRLWSVVVDKLTSD